MAAQSPVAETSPDSRDAYLLSWAAITQMLGKGFSLSGRERNSCFLNLGGGQFADASAISGFDFLDDGRALGLVDWDFDGRPDVWALNRNGPQVRFLHNRFQDDNHFVSLRLKGVECNRDAVGARVEVHLAAGQSGERPTTVIRTLRAGSAFLSQSSKWLHFGLGGADSIEKLVVRWPGGGVDRYAQIAADHQYVLTQGGTEPELWTPPEGRVPLKAQEPEPPAITDVARVVMAARPLLPAIRYQNLEGKAAEVDDFKGKPVLVNLWATWCQPCLRELGEFSQHRDELEETGLEIIALNVDELDEGGEPARRAAAARVLKGLKYPFAAGTADTEVLARLDALQMTNLGMQIPLSLPTSFLLDPQGLVSVIYKGPVEVEQLLADVRDLETAPADRRDQAAPFAGRWLAPPSGSAPVRLALKMVDQGNREAGIAYLERYAARHREGLLPEADPDTPLSQTPLSDVYFAIARLHRQAGETAKAVDAYQKILEVNPQHRKALTDLGHLYLRRGQPGLAARALREVLKMSPNEIDTMSLLATAKLQLGQLDETETLCELILKTDPDHATARLNLGLAAEGRQDFQKAVANYREALRVLPAWDIALNQLTWILSTSSDPDLRSGSEGLSLARRLHQISRGGQPVFLRTLAAAQAESGQFEAALATIDRALAQLPPGKAGLRQTLRKMRGDFENQRPHRVGDP